MHGLSPIPQPPRDEQRHHGENQFSLAQLLSIIFGLCVLSALVKLALDESRISPTAAWLILAGWIAAVVALAVTRLIQTTIQFVLAGVVAMMIAALALAVS